MTNSQSEVGGKALVKKFFYLFNGNFKPIASREYDAVCICSWSTKFKSIRGYSNMERHIKASHKNYKELTVDNEQTLLSEFFYTDKTKTYWGWLDWVARDLHPFAFVEKEGTLKHGGLSGICVDTFMKYLSLLTKVVESKIAILLPDKFALVFDGWSNGTRHYVAIFASIPDAESKLGYKSLLLCFSPLTDEESQSADSHIKYFDFILRLYGKSWLNVSAIIGDNCSTNKSIATKTNTKFIGCASHRFNLAMGLYLKQHETILLRIHDLMTKLQNFLLAAALRTLTPLVAKSRNSTRWSSYFSMVQRYVAIREFIRNIADEEIEPLLLSAREDREIDSVLFVFTRC